MKKEIELSPIKETVGDFDQLEKAIRDLLKREIYEPVLKAFGSSQSLLNAKDDLLSAIKAGRIQFYRGRFKGRFNALISKELKALGAQWDSKTGTWKLPQTSLTTEVKLAIQASESAFQRKIEAVEKRLSAILPGEIADKLKVEKLFDATLWKVEKEVSKTLQGLVVSPKLTKEQRQKIADEWQNNLKLYIKDWSQEKTVELRKQMQEAVFAGNRYEYAIKTIAKSYGTTERKAKFLARQETGLLMAKFKEVRYKDSGVRKFRWTCVTGTAKHPVRDSHKICDKKIFSWDNPKELDKNGIVKANGVSKPGDNLNPGEDYNCRCYAKPIVEFGRNRKE